jgi:hypothetical protein
MKSKFTLSVDVPVNGRMGKATIKVLNRDGTTKTTDRADLTSIVERRKAAQRLAEKLDTDAAKLEAKIEAAWADALDAPSSEEALVADRPKVEILDASPDAIRRPLCLVDKHAYAAAWIPLRVCVRQEVNGLANSLGMTRHNSRLRPSW